MPWLFILFVLVPALELYILIQIGQVIGASNTFLMILATGFLGSWLAKTQGLATWHALNERWAKGQIPGKELIDGAIILVCGALLLTPGVITDVLGLLGLIPGSRAVFRATLQKIFSGHPAIRVGVHMGTGYNSMRTSDSAPENTSNGSGGSAAVSGAAKQRPTHSDTD
ncbi:MAG: FxsA family protein [Bacteroidetes bacterium]|nr:FxsA family protein [Verrucomicrobiota bacterium]MDA0873559.1 FxsA family protein [Bacteroidota bacterium]